MKKIFVTVGAILFAMNLLAQKTPNVVFILADDLGIGDITPYGQKIIKTPNLERLQSEGMRFTQCYAGTAVSAPSRASLLTGLHTGHTFIRGNVRHNPEGQVAMPAGTFTMAQMFHDCGYTTGGFGKWGLGYPGSVSDPVRVGFDEFFGYNCQTRAHDYYPDHLWNGLQRVDLKDNMGNREGTYSADLIHSRAMDFIRKNAQAGRPFFAFLAYTLPHAELRLPQDSVFDYYCRLIPQADEKPYAEKNPNRLGAYGATDRPLAAFASMVTRLDRYVGDVMNELKRLGIADNTILIFTSDNGPHREGGANPDYFNSYGPYRGCKRDLYEGGIRMPFIVSYPGHISEGVDNTQMMAFWDILPTFAELLSYDKSLSTDGISMLPTLFGKHQVGHEYLYWEFHEQGGKQAIRYGQWKGVRLNVADSLKTVFELYDLSCDEHEDNNVASQHPDVVRMLESRCRRVRTESELFDFGRKGEIR